MLRCCCITNQLTGPAEVRTRTLLGADLHDPAVSFRDAAQPLPFTDEECQRLLDVNILAGRTRQHAHQRMPMIGRGDDDACDAFVIQQLAEISMCLAASTSERLPLLPSRGMNITHPENVHIRPSQRIHHMPLADQAEADETEANAFVRPEHPAVRPCRQTEGRQKIATKHADRSFRGEARGSPFLL
jgi:hypothetical protein